MFYKGIKLKLSFLVLTIWFVTIIIHQLLSAGKDYSYVQNLKRSVREAALSMQACKTESSQDSHSEDGSESFFLPLSGTGFSRFGAENKSTAVKSKKLASHADTNLLETRATDNHYGKTYNAHPDMLNDFDLLQDYNRIDDFLSASASNEVSDAQGSIFDLDEAQVFSPPLLMDTTMLSDSYEDLLGIHAIQPLILFSSLSGSLP